MPYSGPADDTLPDRIKKLSAIKRRAFVAAFNSASGDRRPGESAADRESRAFAVANTAANRAGEKDMTTEPPDDIGEKHEHDMMAMPVEAPPFAAGATNFDEYDRYRDEEKRQQALSFTFSTFQALLYNIMENDDVTANARVAGMRALVDQLATRLDEVAANPEMAFKTVPDAPAPLPTGTRALVGAGEAVQGDEDGALTIFKDASGRYRWLAVHSNRYQDREKEFFPEDAHVDYVEWANHTKQFPPLRLWHAPLDLGPGDGLDYASEGFVVSTGTFYPGMEPVARNLKAMADQGRLGCSHGFTYKASDYRGGVYHRYRSFEVTALPLEAAANLLTDFGVKEALMLNPARRKFFEEALGAEGAKTLEAQLASLGQKAQSEGVAFKDIFVGIDLDAATDTTPGAPAAGTKEAPVDDATATPSAVAPAAAPEPTGAIPAADAMPTAADAATSAPLPPALDALAQADALKSFKDMLTGAMSEALAPLSARLDAVETATKALAETKDAAIAAAIRPAVGPTNTVPASLAAGNVVNDADAIAAIKEATAVLGDERSPISPHFKALTRALQSPGD